MLPVASILPGQANRGYEAGSNDRAAQILHVGRHISVAGLETGDALDVVGTEQLVIRQ